MDILIVDDEIERFQAYLSNNATIDARLHFTTDPWQAIKWLEEKDFQIICLDHDLGIDETKTHPVTTMPVVDWIRQNFNEKWHDDRLVIVHSLNAPARSHMVMALERVQCHVMSIPFAWTKKDLFKTLAWSN